MIICRTPTRISLFGGGTDYPIWYKENGGAVLSATINKYSYITLRRLPKIFDYNFRIRYYKTEEVQSISEIKHPSVRECALNLKVFENFEIVHNADLPAGTGLGSSSTFTVGMLHAFYTLKNYMPTKRELAMKALEIEQQVIGEAVGSQDQVAAAFGGFNKIKFGGDREFEVDPIIMEKSKLQEMQDGLLLCFTGFSRSAPEIARHQIENTPDRNKELSEISDITNEAFTTFNNPSFDFKKLGLLLNEQWRIKRTLTKHISNSSVDEIYDIALKNGAIGGKLLGAGGGGFMLFLADPANHDRIKASLADKYFVDFRFEDTGSKIVYYSHE